MQLEKPESEAEYIVAALRIQNAYRNYNRKKAMRAAARIQSHFRTWKMRRNFLAMRREAIRIQVSSLTSLFPLPSKHTELKVCSFKCMRQSASQYSSEVTYLSCLPKILKLKQTTEKRKWNVGSVCVI